MAVRGRPPKGVERSNILLRLPTDLIKQVDTFKESLEAERGGFVINRTDMLIRLIEVGLQTLTQARQPATQPAPARPVNRQGVPALSVPESQDAETPVLAEIAQLATEALTVSADMAAVLADQDEEEMPVPLPVVPQSAPASHPNRQGASATSARAIPLETLQAIADAAAEYNKLSFAQLAQLLYERNIYRTKDPVTGQEKPINKGTLKRWIERARTADLLWEGRREP
jgi:hypothetical protein